MADVMECAHYLIQKGTRKHYPPITHLKLQKLLYYAQVYSLLSVGRRLFNNHFEAWVHGPVCPEVYNNFKQYSKNTDLGFALQNQINKEFSLSYSDQNILNIILNTYGKLSGEQLEFLTHREKPWIIARDGLEFWESGDRKITDESIRKSYVLVK